MSSEPKVLLGIIALDVNVPFTVTLPLIVPPLVISEALCLCSVGAAPISDGDSAAQAPSPLRNLESAPCAGGGLIQTCHQHQPWRPSL